jgi:hypothetical protein
LIFVYREVKQLIHTTWWDNFNRAYAVAMQSMVKDAHLLCNWTGIGMRIPHSTIDVSNLSLDLKAGVPGFPSEDIFSDVFSHNRNLTDGLILGTSMASVAKFSRVNWTAKHVVRRIPVKATVNKVKYPEIHERSGEGRTGLSNFYPVELSPENIGSNIGLFQLMRNEWDAHNGLVDSAKKYRIIVADCNIYNRIVKVSVKHIARITTHSWHQSL